MPGLSPPAVGVAPPFVDAIPVAPNQWPYDAMLLAAILKKAAATSGFRPDPVVIGIAEGALASADGAPLSTDMFASIREDNPEPDEDDDDGNGYLNDLIGAGPFRRVETMPSPYRGTGDIGLLSDRDAGVLVVGAKKHRAGESRIDRRDDRGRAADPCRGFRGGREAAEGHVLSHARQRLCRRRELQRDRRAGDLALAFDYLEDRSQIINISYSVRPDAADQLVGTMLNNLTSSNKLLVLPSGNDFPGNLDDNPDFCPACLGNPDRDSTMV